MIKINTKINEFTYDVSTTDINHNKNIVVTDLQGNDTIVCQCLCTINAGTSISKYIQVLDESLFLKVKEGIQPSVDIWKCECDELAIKYNVPLI
ncbi:MAG: hypothetical protein ACRCX8_00600 [Sarcina sp.]